MTFERYREDMKALHVAFIAILALTLLAEGALAESAQPETLTQSGSASISRTFERPRRAVFTVKVGKRTKRPVQIDAGFICNINGEQVFRNITRRVRPGRQRNIAVRPPRNSESCTALLTITSKGPLFASMKITPYRSFKSDS